MNGYVGVVKDPIAAEITRPVVLILLNKSGAINRFLIVEFYCTPHHFVSTLINL